MVDRIKKVMELKNLSSTQLADTIEVPRATISHILSERNKPSLDVILKIVGAFKDIDMHWLLLGDGDALASKPAADETKQAEEAPQPQEQIPLGNELLALGKEQDKQIKQIVIFYSDNSFASFRPNQA